MKRINMKNVIYLHCHDCGRFIEPYGYKIPTPNLMKLARESMLFTSCFSTAPTCSPSRAGLLTGQMPHTNGMFGLAHLGFHLFNYKDHLSWRLKNQGFNTAIFGVQHESENPQEELGYDVVVRSRLPITRDQELKNVEECLKYLNSYDSDKPLFMSVGMFYPHRPFMEDFDKIKPNEVKVPETCPNNEETRKDMAGYINSANFMDECLGKVIEALKANGMYDNSLVIFTTDHGIAFPGMKCTLSDFGTGVSLMMHTPEMKKGTISDALVSHLNVVPTIFDYLGLPIPTNLQFPSILPLLKGNKEEINEAVFSEVNYHVAYEPKRSIRTKKYKYSIRYSDEELLPPSNTDDGYSKVFMHKEGYFARPVEKEEFYDMLSDPLEQHNEIDNPKYKEIIEKLKKELYDFQVKTNDPILKNKDIEIYSPIKYGDYDCYFISEDKPWRVK